MEKLSFYLKNQLVNPPRNWRETQIELNFNIRAGETKQKFVITDYDFVLENAQLIKQHISDGYIFEGLPLRIEIDSASGNSVLFDGYLDIPNSGDLSDKINSNCRLVENESTDWLNDVADSFTFEYLYREYGSITDSDFVKVPYVLSTIPNYTNSAIALVGVYVMAKEVKDQIEKIKSYVADMPVYYVFSTYIKLILYIIYLILVLIALVKLVKDLMLLILQPVKYHSCMSASTLLSKGAEYLGLTIFAPDFQPNGTFELMHVMPEKYYVPENSVEKKILGFTKPENTKDGFYKGTFGDLLRDLKLLINGKVFVKNKVIYLVRADYKIGNPQYTMPPIENNYYRYNADEFNSNVYLTFQTDMQDKNTIHEYLGTSYQVQFQPNTVVNQKMVLMKGLKEVRFPFALAKTKNTLTTPEKLMEGFIKGVGKFLGALVKATNTVIKVLNKVITAVNKILKALGMIGIKIKFQLPLIPLFSPPNFAEQFVSRIGMLALENDNFSTKKVVLLDVKSTPKATKINNDNFTKLNAHYIYNNFYYTTDFLPSNDKPSGNQFKLQTYQNVPFTHDNFLKVYENNTIFANNGNECEIDSLKWNPFKQTAEIKLREPFLYTNNLRKIELEPDGQ